jgi:OmcA/MtrC family decaheme c-type cytochrome
MIRFTHRWQQRLVHFLTVAILGMALAASGPTRGAAQVCIGDCDGNGMVTVDNVITMANITLGSTPIDACTAGLPDQADSVTIDLIVTAVNNAIVGCAVVPTGTPTNTPISPAPTPTATATGDVVPTPPTAGAGLVSTISSVMIDSGGLITVTFTLTDAAGVPLTPSLSSTSDPNKARTRFAIAHVENYSGGGEFDNQFSRYVNDVNATRPGFDSGGTLTTIDPAAGMYRYTFKTMLPADFDPTRTYTVGMQTDRTYQGQQLGVDPVFDVVPAGGTPQIREAVTTEQCNSCHAPLIAHGNRREVRLCLLCHTEAAVDPKGTTIDFRNMIHKLHRGKDLPSVVNGPPGSFYGIFSNFSQSYAIFAQKDDNGMVTGIGFPHAIQECLTCHAEGPTSVYYHDRPSAAACATCHDDVNPSQSDTAAGPPGTNHFQSRGYADGDCTFCHTADSGKEFDISVVGAHVVPERSKRLQGLNFSITGITNHAAGEAPTISFKVTDNAGTALRDLSGLNRVGFAISGPTTDYARVLTPTAVGGGASGALVGPDDMDVFQYTPTTAIPADATGTWSLGVEARRSVTLTAVDPIPNKTVNEAAVNQVVTFTVDDSTAEMRRLVVEVQRCGNCHGEFSKDFSIHGGLRNQTEYCVLCHNPNNSDVARRQRDPAAVAAGDAVSSIDFKVMIHKIHRGENLEQQPYLIYGFGSAPLNYSINNFGEVRFPGDLRICTTCHASGTYLFPPFPGTALGTQVAHLDPATGNPIIDGRLGPIRSVCTSCHDGEDAMAHAETQTTGSGVESCPVCHEEGRAFAISELHAGRN